MVDNMTKENRHKREQVISIDIYYKIKDKITLLMKPDLMLRPMMKNLKDRKELIGAEIGVAYGVNANVMLRCLDIKKLFLIDPYEPYNQYGLRCHYNKHYNVMLKNTKNYKDRVVVIKEYSDKAVNYLPDNMDFVYIDGNHSHPTVDADIELYYEKVKLKGILGGHDFNSTNSPDVVEAVIDFSHRKNIKFFVEKNDWWVIK